MKEAGAEQHLSFIRVYSDRQESKRYPVNGWDLSVTKMDKVPQMDKNIEKDSLHYKIRLPSNRCSEPILNFEKKFGPGSKERPSSQEYAGYKETIAQAEVL